MTQATIRVILHVSTESPTERASMNIGHTTNPTPRLLPRGQQVTEPLAAEGLTSYRYRVSDHDHMAIGAVSHADAIREASRGLAGQPDFAKLDVWNGRAYIAAFPFYGKH